jgi:hypothetical protein
MSRVNKPKVEEAKTMKTKVSKGEVRPIKVRNVLKSTWSLLANNKKIIAKLSLIYGIIYIVLVQALSAPLSAVSIKDTFLSAFENQLTASFNTFSYILSNNTTNSSNATSGIYQVVLILLFSLVFIYVFRKAFKKQNTTVKESMYQSMYPLIPYLVVLFIILLELIPMDIGLVLYSLVTSGGIINNIVEQIIFSILLVGFVGFSLYLLSNSIVSLYIVTLKDMTPLNSLRSAKQLVMGRRFSVILTILLLPVILLLVAGVVLIPLIMLIPALASWTYFILLIIALPIIHSYLYSLYRELIK